MFFTRADNRLLRPGLAAALPSLRPVTTPLKRSFNRIDAQLSAAIRQTRLLQENLTRLHQVFSLKLS